MRKTIARAVVCMILAIGLFGCGDAAKTNDNGAALTAISVTPANPSIPAGATQQFTATGTYSDNTTQNITASVAWTSSDQNKASISSAGLATAVAVGSLTIKAASGSISATTILTITEQTGTYSISGSVTSSGGGLQGVTMTLNSSTTETTDASGSYAFSGLSNGGYTITPSKTGYSFTPTSSAQTINGANISGVTFDATSSTPSAVDVTGTWIVTQVNPIGEGGSFTMDLTQLDSSVTGTVTMKGFSGPISGSLNGNNITLTAADPDPACSGSVGTNTGTVNGNMMSGNYTATAGGICPDETGTWTATKGASGVGAPFAIANTTNYESGRLAAFDGTNYLVTFKSAATSTTNPMNSLAQFVDQSGNLVGSQISFGQTQKDQLIAFDGTNFLVVGNPSYAAGQFLSNAGATVGSSIIISSPTGTVDELWGLAFGGGNYLVVYQYSGNPSVLSSYTLYGRIVSPSGAIGSEISIGNPGGPNSSINNIAFDGTNFLVVWDTGAEIGGQFVGSSGSLVGTGFTIHTKQPNQTGNPAVVGFDGTNYLVAWVDNVTAGMGYFNGTADILGQMVTPAGALSGNVLNISVAAGDQPYPSIAFDGTNFLVAWTDFRNDSNHDFTCDTSEGTCGDIYGQYISKSGNLMGSEFAINQDAGNQFGGLAGFSNGKYLTIQNSEDFSASGADSLTGGVYGVLVTP